MLKGVCRFFNTTGKCRFGKHCRFSHNFDTSEHYSRYHSSQLGIDSDKKGHIPVQEHTTTTQEDQGQNYEGLNSLNVSDKREVSKISQQLGRNEKNGSIKNSEVDNQAKIRDSKICRFYAHNRFCRYGKSCRFEHVQQPLHHHLSAQNEDLKEVEQQSLLQDEDPRVGQEDDSVPRDIPPNPTGRDNSRYRKDGRQRRRRICKYFKAGKCQFGSKCRYFHTVDPLGIGKEIEESMQKEIKGDGSHLEKEKMGAQRSAIKPRAPPLQRLHFFKRDLATEEELKELRKTEIQQLKKRFPSSDLEIVKDTDEESIFIFNFSSTDPDWPYDVQVFQIEVIFDVSYPMKLFEVRLPLEQDLPETVRRYIEVSLQEWLKKKCDENERKNIVEMVFRPFLRWLDRSLEDIVTEGLKQLRREVTAKAAGFEFIAAKPAVQSSKPEPVVDTAESTNELKQKQGVEYRKTEQEEIYTGPEWNNSTDGSNDEESDEEEESSDDNENRQKGPLAETERRGTELTLRNMQLQWHVASMFVENIFLSVQCERCKHATEFATPPHRVSCVPCTKCHNQQLVKYRPVLAHHYSDIIGYLDLDGCAVRDCILQNCVFTVNCYTCSRDYSTKRLCPGVLFETFCHGCRNKLKFSADSVKFSKLLPSGADLGKGKVHKVSVKSLKRAQKDPAIQEGKPLPEFGACKHYKKSFRWLRFPCCGKCYPCDVCHDMKEMDHDMIFANRMICGYCAKEQMYSAEKPCIACSSSLTKSHTDHWEGGKGCRNKVTMSKNDNQKYSNTNKTVSNRAKMLKKKSSGKKKH